jgi:preprotein translocase subunit SecG
MDWEWWLAYGSMALLIFVGLLLMIVILLQRGRGGGLAGAFGGAGGQSAFGTRAGDVFTKITAVMAIIWVFLAGVSRLALEPLATQRAASFQTQAELEAGQTPAARGTGDLTEGEGDAGGEPQTNDNPPAIPDAP